MAFRNRKMMYQSGEPERGRTASFWLTVGTLGASSLLGTLNSMSLNAFLPFIANDLDVSVALLGQVVTVVLILGAAIGIVTGPLADRYGHRLFMTFGAGTIIVTALGTAVATSFALLLAFRLVSSLSAGLLRGVALAMTATLFIADQRRRAMSWVIAGAAIAPMVGIPALTLLGSSMSWRLAFVALAAVALAIMFLLVVVLPPDTPAESPQEPIRPLTILSSYRPLITNRVTRTLYAASFTRAVGWMGSFIYFGAFLQHRFDLDAGTIGLGYLVAGGGYFFGSLAAGEWLGRIALRPLCTGSSAAMGVFLCATLALPISAQAAILLMGITALLGGISFACFTTLLANESTAGRATTMSLNSTIFALGSAGGSAIGGLLIASGGYGPLGIGLSGFLLVSALLVWQPWPATAAAPNVSAD